MLDSQRETQYIVKAYHNPRLSGGVYDDLGLSCLVGIEETDEGFLISAFDTPLGVFKPDTDCIFRMQGEGWEIAKSEEVYRLLHSGEPIAEIGINGTEITLSTENSGQAIMVIAAALVALEHSKKHSAESPTPRRTAIKSTRKPMTKESSREKKSKKDPIITVNVDALRERLAKYKLDKAVTVAAELILSIRFRVQGKTLATMAWAIAVCIALFITGLVGTAVKTSKIQNVESTQAVVSVKQSGATTAVFKVGNYAYSITLKGYDLKNNRRLPIYFTKKADGTLDKYFMKEPSNRGYVTLSVVSIILAVLIFVFMFIGNPFKKYKEWNIKGFIKRLRPTSEQNEEERLVEHTAYVTSADVEPENLYINDVNE